MLFLRNNIVGLVMALTVVLFVSIILLIFSPFSEVSAQQVNISVEVIDGLEIVDAGGTFDPNVCGNGIVEPSEECDDGNTIVGDGCDRDCQLVPIEVFSTELIEPIPTIFTASGVTLEFYLNDTSAVFNHLSVFLSFEGGSYVEYPVIFTTSPIFLTGLLPGNYDAYTIGVTNQNVYEDAPANPDVHFIIQSDGSFVVKAYPEIRRDNDWGVKASLSVVHSVDSTAVTAYNIKTDDSGLYLLDNEFETGTYDFGFKGFSHLTSFLRDIDVQFGLGRELDFTRGGIFKLYAGDVHSSKDDFINSYDLAASIKYLYLPNEDADLNLDNTVNSLDLSVIITNLYMAGDTP